MSFVEISAKLDFVRTQSHSHVFAEEVLAAGSQLRRRPTEPMGGPKISSDNLFRIVEFR